MPLPWPSPFLRTEASAQKHAVAVRKKPIPRFDRMPVRGEYMLTSGERRDEHQQRRLWKVEVRQQGIDYLKLISGRKEDGGRSGVRCKWLARILRSTVLQGAYGGRAHGDNASALRLRPVDGLGGRSGQGIRLLMKMDVGEFLHAEWLEGA